MRKVVKAWSWQVAEDMRGKAKTGFGARFSSERYEIIFVADYQAKYQVGSEPNFEEIFHGGETCKTKPTPTLKSKKWLGQVAEGIRGEVGAGLGGRFRPGRYEMIFAACPLAKWRGR